MIIYNKTNNNSINKNLITNNNNKNIKILFKIKEKKRNHQKR